MHNYAARQVLADGSLDSAEHYSILVVARFDAWLPG